MKFIKIFSSLSISIVKLLFIILFLVIIALPMLDTAFNINIVKLANIGENRALAKLPEFKIKEIQDYPKKFEKYINDNVAFRTQVIKIYHYVVGWCLYSPVSDSYRVGNERYSTDLLRIYLDTPRKNIPFLDILEGMNYVSNYHNAKFMYIAVPDKITYQEKKLPIWIQSFKKRHYKPSYYEQVNKDISNRNFLYIDLFKVFNEKYSDVFSDRYDPHHYDHNGLDMALSSIMHYMSQYYSKIDLNKYLKSYKIEYRINDTYPYYGAYGKEELPHMVSILPTDNIKVDVILNDEKLNYPHKWHLADYVVNTDNPDGVNILFASDSSFKALWNTHKISGSFHASVLPFYYIAHKYIHTFDDINFVNYADFIKYISYIHADIVLFSFTERMLPIFPQDTIFQIVGRYALHKNENFVFPENIINSRRQEAIVDINIDENNRYLNIDKELITDSNGEIYISFRYQAPNKTKSTLEYAFNENFKDSKKIQLDISGGG